MLLYLSHFGYAGSSLLRGLFSSCGEWGLLPGCGAQSSHCGGFSCCGAQAQGSQASVVVALGLWSVGSVSVVHEAPQSTLAALRHVGSSRTKDGACVPCTGR